MEAADYLKTEICCYRDIVGGNAPPVTPGSDPVHNWGLKADFSFEYISLVQGTRIGSLKHL